MRLTLRTLLAYMDDTLEPSEARELGKKIAESDFARDLMDRIRKVVRTRRLAAPRPTSSRVDANLVAEYLDNVLDPERVREFEAACLKSDEELAEVAACHQILTLLGQPARVSPELKERLFRCVERHLELQRREREPRPVPEPVPPHLAGDVPQLPVLRIVVTLAVVLGLAVAIWKAGEFFAVGPVAQRQETPTSERAEKPAGEASEPVAQPSEQEPASTEIEEPGSPASAETTPEAPAGAGAASGEAAEQKTDVAEPTAPTAESTEPPAPAPAEQAQTEPAGEPQGQAQEATPAQGTPPAEGRPQEGTERPQPADAEPTRPSSGAAVEGLLAAATGPVAVKDLDGTDWAAVEPPAKVKVNQKVTNLPGVRSRLEFGNWVVTLVGRTGVLWLKDVIDREGPPMLHVHFGRVLINPRTAPGTLRVMVATSHVFEFSFTDTATGIAIEAEPVYVPGQGGDYRVTVVVVRNKVDMQLFQPELRVRGEEEAAPQADGENTAPRPQGAADAGRQPGGEAPAEQQPENFELAYVSRLKLPLDETKDAVFGLRSGAVEVRDRVRLPDWVSGAPQSPVKQRELAKFVAALRGEPRINVRLLELVHGEDVDVAVKELALESLVALGKLGVPVELLRSVGNEGLWQKAVQELRWYMFLGLPESKAVFEALKEAYAAEGEEGVAEQLAHMALDLLAGAAPEAVRQEAFRQVLVELLSPEADLGLRRLAWLTVRELTGSDHNYNPELPGERAIQAIKRALDRLASRVGGGGDGRIP